MRQVCDGTNIELRKPCDHHQSYTLLNGDDNPLYATGLFRRCAFLSCHFSRSHPGILLTCPSDLEDRRHFARRRPCLSPWIVHVAKPRASHHLLYPFLIESRVSPIQHERVVQPPIIELQNLVAPDLIHLPHLPHPYLTRADAA